MGGDHKMFFKILEGEVEAIGFDVSPDDDRFVVRERIACSFIKLEWLHTFVQESHQGASRVTERPRGHVRNVARVLFQNILKPTFSVELGQKWKYRTLSTGPFNSGGVGVNLDP